MVFRAVSWQPKILVYLLGGAPKLINSIAGGARGGYGVEGLIKRLPIE